MNFTVYPAIDLQGGRCVRLRQGDFEQVTVYNDDPALAAARWAAEGAAWLHVVDLDGAKAGAARNTAAIKAIRAAVRIPIQVGGGVRTMADVEAALALGVDRVILGTAAIHDIAFVAEAARRFGGQIAVGIDARDGKAAGGGWLETSALSALALCETAARAGARHIIYTDIAQDGMMRGPNLPATQAAVAAAPGCAVIASGGVSSLADVANAKQTGAAGVIVGAALYRGAFTLPEALAAAK